MRTSVLIALAGVAALIGGVARAQTDTSVNPINQPRGDVRRSGRSSQFISSDTLGDPSKLKAGDPGVVSNPPVPDTPDNRAAYGNPMSDAGKRTAPTGD